MAFSPDGRTVATASDDTTAIIWDTTTGQPVTTLRGHTDWVRAVAFSPDGQTRRHRQRRHHRHHLGHHHRPTGHDPHAATPTGSRAVAFSPDGQTVATASDDTTAIIWDTTTGQPVHDPPGHTDWVRSVGYAPDGQTARHRQRRHARPCIWATTTGQPVMTLGQTAGVAGSAFASRAIASGPCAHAAATVGIARPRRRVAGTADRRRRRHGHRPRLHRAATRSW